MTVTLTSPATIFELADLAGAMTRLHWSIAKGLARSSHSYAFHAGDELVALAGLLPEQLPGGGLVTELWFCPGPKAGRHMLGIVQASKLTLARSPYRGIYTICRSEPGKRLARLLGFSPAGSSELGEIWAYGGPSDRQGRQGRDESAAGGAGGAAAPVALEDGGRPGRARPAGNQ
jgi:hypothetical protein